MAYHWRYYDFCILFILLSPSQVFLLQIFVVTIHCFINKKNNNYTDFMPPITFDILVRYFQPIKIVLTFKEHHCIIYITQNAIIAHTSQDYRKYITRFSNMHHKILNIHHKIFEYTSQDFEHTSQDYWIYITRYWIYITRYWTFITRL